MPPTVGPAAWPDAGTPEGLRETVLLLRRSQHPVINVAEVGGYDDTDALQRSFDLLKRNRELGTEIYIPPGSFEITRPIHAENLKGIMINGSGARPSIAQGCNPELFGRGSQLVWKGPRGESMFNLVACNGVRVQNLAFIGTPINTNDEWVKVRYTEVGMRAFRIASQYGSASGCFVFENCLFGGWQEAVNFGAGGYIGNAADSTFRDCVWERCAFGVKLDHLQAVNFRFDRPQFMFVGTCIVLNGGNVHVTQLCTYDVKRLFHTLSSGGGTNLGTICVSQARLDGLAERTQLLCADGITTRALFQCVHQIMNVPKGPPRVEINNGYCTVWIDKCVNMVDENGSLFSIKNSFPHHPVAESRVIVSDCELPSDLNLAIGPIINGGYVFRDCPISNAPGFHTDVRKSIR